MADDARAFKVRGLVPEAESVCGGRRVCTVLGLASVAASYFLAWHRLPLVLWLFLDVGTEGTLGTDVSLEPTLIVVVALCRGRPFSCDHARVKLMGGVLARGGAAVIGAAPVVPHGFRSSAPHPLAV